MNAGFAGTLFPSHTYFICLPGPLFKKQTKDSRIIHFRASAPGRVDVLAAPNSMTLPAITGGHWCRLMPAHCTHTIPPTGASGTLLILSEECSWRLFPRGTDIKRRFEGSDVLTAVASFKMLYWRVYGLQLVSWSIRYVNSKSSWRPFILQGNHKNFPSWGVQTGISNFWRASAYFFIACRPFKSLPNWTFQQPWGEQYL